MYHIRLVEVNRGCPKGEAIQMSPKVSGFIVDIGGKIQGH